jgi:drug/metabolite transporter (DMT)-like permease
MNTNRRLAVAALIAAGLLWGTTVPLSKLALEWLPTGWLTATRFGLAAAVMLTVVRRTRPGLRALARSGLRAGRRPALRAAGRPGRSGVRSAWSVKVLVSGAIGYGGSVIVQNAGIARTSVTHAALLIGAVPVMVAVVAALWQHTVARPVAWAGFAISLAGVGLVTAGGGGGGATLAGDGLVLASLLLSAVFTVGQARLLRGRDPVAVTAVQFLGAALGALAFTVITEGVPAAPADAGPVLAVAALAAGGTLLPFTLFAYGQSRVSAEVAGAFYNLEPLVGVAAGAVVFGNPVGIALVGGGTAILAGIGLSSLPLVTAARGRPAGERDETAGAPQRPATARPAASSGGRSGAASALATGVSTGGSWSSSRPPGVSTVRGRREAAAEATAAPSRPTALPGAQAGDGGRVPRTVRPKGNTAERHPGPDVSRPPGRGARRGGRRARRRRWRPARLARR